MINLLPPEEKDNIFSKRVKRLTVALSFTALIPLWCLLIFLVAVNFYVLIEKTRQAEVLQEGQRQYVSDDFVFFNESIDRSNNLLSRIENFYRNEFYANQAIRTILKIDRPEGISLKHISLKREVHARLSVEISGTSQIRDNLLLFKNNIEKEPGITNVSLSLADLLRPRNVDFIINFKISHAR